MKTTISKILKVLLSTLRVLVGLHDAAHKNRETSENDVSPLNSAKQ